MAIAITPASASTPAMRSVTVNVTGGAATTAYIVTVTQASGGVGHVGLTTDGSGNASFVHTPGVPGTTTFDIRPAVEHQGATTAAATGTLKSTGAN